MVPHSLGSPSYGYGTPKVGEDKTAGDDLVDLVGRSIKQRALNNVLDKVFLDSPAPAATQPNPELEKKRVEISSEHPEMAKLLEDEKNKAYLEKLLNSPK